MPKIACLLHVIPVQELRSSGVSGATSQAKLSSAGWREVPPPHNSLTLYLLHSGLIAFASTTSGIDSLFEKAHINTARYIFSSGAAFSACGPVALLALLMGRSFARLSIGVDLCLSALICWIMRAEHRHGCAFRHDVYMRRPKLPEAGHSMRR